MGRYSQAYFDRWNRTDPVGFYLACKNGGPGLYPEDDETEEEVLETVAPIHGPIRYYRSAEEYWGRKNSANS